MSKVVKLDDDTQFGLPPSLIGRTDISRLLREIEQVDNELETQLIRNPEKPLAIPSMSKALVDTTTLNNIDVANNAERKRLLTSLREAKDKAPVVHITFAADPEPATLSQLIVWIRENLHPRALIGVGLQPRIVGGCIVRTPDHIYDFSIRKRFQEQRAVLETALHEAIAGRK